MTDSWRQTSQYNAWMDPTVIDLTLDDSSFSLSSSSDSTTVSESSDEILIPSPPPIEPCGLNSSVIPKAKALNAELGHVLALRKDQLEEQALEPIREPIRIYFKECVEDELFQAVTTRQIKKGGWPAWIKSWFM